MALQFNTLPLKPGFIRKLPLAIAVSLICSSPLQAADPKQTYCMNSGEENNYDCSKTISVQSNPADIDAKLRELNRWLEDEEKAARGGSASAAITSPTDEGLKDKIEFNSRLLASELKQARQLQDRGDHQGAFDQVNAYLVTNPKDPNGWLLYGISLMDQNKLDAAANIFSKLIQLYPNAPEPYNNLAAIYARKGDNDKAVETLLQAFNTHPSYAQLQQNLKTVYATLATQAYNRALNLDKGETAPTAQLAILDQVYQPQPLPAQADVATAPVTKPTVEKPAIQVAAAPVTTQETAAESAQSATLVIEERKVSEGSVPELPAEDKAEQSATIASTVTEASAEPETATITEAAKTTDTQEVAQVTEQQPHTTEKVATHSLDDATAKTIHNLINDWAGAWSAQDVGRYLEFYIPSYTPSSDITNKQWRWGRNKRLTKPEFIKVDITDISLAPMPDGRIRTVFLQSYESNSFRDAVYKTLIFEPQDGNWKIAVETSL